MLNAIKVENLSKAYQLGQIGTGTISRDIERWYAMVRGKEDPFLKIGETNDRTVKGTSDVVWSLKDINFEIEQGDAVGIIGRNGAGKSTLLKVLSRVTSPTTGKITGNGRIASLLEVGTGFHPDLTGRENIYLNGAILGMRKKEIARKFDAIVDFAGVERYIDTPVKRYSSGMYVRLAFAVAAHLESEILIVDEVLAVGDAEFQNKCLGKMGEVSKGEGRTVLFVSHNMDAISNLCNKAILLKNGTLEKRGLVKECIQLYKDKINFRTSEWINNPDVNYPHFNKINIHLLEKQPHHKLYINFSVSSPVNFPPAFVAFDIKNGMGTTIIQAIPHSTPFIKFDKTCRHYSVIIELNGLIPDLYTLSAWIGPHNIETYDWQKDIVNFEIDISPIQERTISHSYANGFIIAESTISEIKTNEKIIE